MMFEYWVSGALATAAPSWDQLGVPTMMMVFGSMARMAGITWLA